LHLYFSFIAVLFAKVLCTIKLPSHHF